jgi:hypothetical protein
MCGWDAAHPAVPANTSNSRQAADRFIYFLLMLSAVSVCILGIAGAMLHGLWVFQYALKIGIESFDHRLMLIISLRHC